MDTGFISTCPLVKYLQCSTLIIKILSNFTNCKNKKLIIFLLYDLLKTSEEIRIWQKDLPRLNANIAHDDRWDTPFGAVSCYKYHMLGLLWQYWQEWVSTCIFKSSQYRKVGCLMIMFPEFPLENMGKTFIHWDKENLITIIQNAHSFTLSHEITIIFLWLEC